MTALLNFNAFYLIFKFPLMITELYLLAICFFFRAAGQIVTTASGVFIVGGWAASVGENQVITI